MCGPLPVLYVVSGLPPGSCTVNETVVGRPGVIVPLGLKPASVNTFAAATVGAVTVPPELLPHPASATAASSPEIAARLIASRP